MCYPGLGLEGAKGNSCKSWWNPNKIWSLVTSDVSMLVSSVQFSLVAQLCPTPWDPMDCSTPGFPVHHQLPEPTQTHVHHWFLSFDKNITAKIFLTSWKIGKVQDNSILYYFCNFPINWKPFQNTLLKNHIIKT